MQIIRRSLLKDSKQLDCCIPLLSS